MLLTNNNDNNSHNDSKTNGKMERDTNFNVGSAKSQSAQMKCTCTGEMVASSIKELLKTRNELEWMLPFHVSAKFHMENDFTTIRSLSGILTASNAI